MRLKGLLPFCKQRLILIKNEHLISAGNDSSAIQEDEKMLAEETLVFDCGDDAEKIEDDELGLAVEGVLLEMDENEGEVGRDEDPPQVGKRNSSNIGFLDPENEFLDLDHEEKPMMHEIGRADTNNTSCDDEQPYNQETKQYFISCSSDPMEKGDQYLDDDQNMAVQPSLPTENDYETESETTEKHVVEQHLSNQNKVAETPPRMQGTQYSDSKADALDSNPSNIGAQVELRKSRSFHFGVLFNTRSEESDQTPLLYQDSNLSNQNSGVQTENPLQFEAVQVVEKTFRSNSESSLAPNQKITLLLS